ncbi:MAG TPA: lysophospholipid acyltransferase family protein [Gemmatimonadales bacterium]|nr:lysophospholipid acyltransferase family protein [Gemmatimonadales bacterium]
MRRRSDFPAYLLMRAALGLVGPLPRAAALATGAALGRLARTPLGLRREVADRNIAAAFPALSAAERETMARRMYAHFGRVAMDSLRLTAGGARAVVPLMQSFEGEDVLRSAIARGRGLIMLTGHLGNWEAGAACVAAKGLPFAAVVKPPSNPWVAAYVERSRRRAGVEPIPMPEARSAVLGALAAGKVVGLVADQGAMRSPVWVPFFGKPTQTPVGPGLFAARSGAPVMFGSTTAVPGGGYRTVVEMLDERPGGDVEEMVVRIATMFRRRLEAAVRLAPEQYLWTHRLWDRQPPPASGGP